MSLMVHLPLNGNLLNNGLKEVNITAIEATPTYVAGKIGQCYQRANVDTQLTNGLKIDDNFLTTFGTLASVAVWVKPLGTHTHYNGTILSSGNWNAKKWAFGVSQDNSKVDVLCGAYNNYIDCPVPINTWTHLVSTFDNGVCKLYKNGVYIGEKTGLAAFDSDANWTGVCRESYAGGYFGFNGLINDLRIYNHALSAKEVKEISKGLVAHYKLDDIYSEPTTNLFKPNPCRGGARWSPLGNGVKIDWTSNAGDTYWYLDLASGVTLTEGATYTFSCKCIGIGTNTIMFRWCNLAGYEVYLHNGWNQYTFLMPATNITNPFFDDINRDTSLSNLLIYDFLLEAKDHGTGYTSTSRTESIIYDSSGYNHDGIINGILLISTNTSRYNISTVFNGTDNAIKIPFNDTIVGPDYTISVWTYKTSIGTKGYQTILGGPSGFELEARSGSGTNPLYRIHNWGGGTTAYEFNKWTLFTFVRTANDSKLYVNGELRLTGTTGSLPVGNYYIGAWATATQQNYEGQMSDFRIYCTALSADDIKELYNIPAYIDNKQNFSAYELIEDDNAEVRKTGVLEGVSFYESGTDALHYDTQIYTEPDGSKWAHIAHHNNPAGGVFPSNSKWNLGVYVDANRWYDVELIVAISDKYEFMVKQKPTSDGTEVKYRWILTVSPLTATWNDVKPGTVTNITTSGYTNGGNGGMYIANNNTHICIANGSSGNWWGGIGTYTVYQGGIPGYPSVVVTTGYEDLYIRIYPEVLIYNSGQIKSNTFYEI